MIGSTSNRVHWLLAGVFPDSGIMKLNFDAANRYDNDYGWGFVLSSKGDVVCGETMHGESFLGDEVEEAKACQNAL